ncbi:sugar O-acetyltransferase [Flammeovirga yaeyamensis]|uniref:Acetyltransferase n=1 Tax=Flammeovirga yaeyamensis TaxID=367791 RepID=A0AAX1N2N9_9BACT|nr:MULTISPECIES: sugar O-acetyltransferase [Flammeovirga]ANQ47955.1 sugar O-acetyltransferase [Flammeovirga sp. MY04]MBB3700882.1 acetyltransferase-like isoleucine patch superfamily enzyme [Flammeovirga yaeyamensis]NMF37990.1 sugar O-acetyltransferase [Flammeovirga yaeyamensis]QWG00641.1 sugar O-acetyltransferase [Flammeovirga yaeyamensis]
MTEKEKMINGLPYNADEPSLVADRKRAKKLMKEYNDSPVDLKKEVLDELFGQEFNAHIEAPFRVDYGYNIKIGHSFYSNFNLTILDVAPVEIGYHVFIAPNVLIATAGHPVDPIERSNGVEFGKPIKIGNRVWIGGNVVILPGVTIGDNVTIGAGSVVTKDIPSNTVAVGNPCKVIKHI